MYRDHWIKFFAILASMPIAATAAAEVISFDEIPGANANCCYVTAEYADLGVTFVTTDDGSIWAGLSNGNPGGWYLEGTNGPAFLGFNGASLSATLLFDTPVNQFSLDMAPTIGWYDPADLFVVDGYRDGVLVDSVTTPPPEFAEWMTVQLAGDVDEVQISSVGPTFPNAYGIDNIQWTPAPDATVPDPTTEPDPTVPDPSGDVDETPSDLSVEIEVNPWLHHHHRFLDLFSRGLTRVAILGSADFDVSSIDVGSLGAGPGMAGATHCERVRDFNRDGIPDLMVLFPTRKLGLAFGDSQLCVTGATLDGQPFEACDTVDTAPFRRHGHEKHHAFRH